MRQVQTDGQRLLTDLSELAQIGGGAHGGVNRPAYSDADIVARMRIREMMRDAGLEVRVDAAGNTIGRRDGQASSLPPLLIGSHTDTVPNGGRYDGALGVLAAIEAARVLHERGGVTRHPLEIVDFQNEEGGLIGSKIMAGRFDTHALALPATSGRTIAEGIALLGGDPDRLDEARRTAGSIAGYLELHIEQGRVLELAGADIGIVEGLVGIRYWEITFEGVASHAGTTPMADRHDALLAAARFVDAVQRVVTSEPGRQVGTVGRLAVFPGGANVIPGRVVLTLELRDLEVAKIDALFAQLEAESRRIARATGTSVAIQPTHTNEPSPTNPAIQDAVARAARARTRW